MADEGLTRRSARELAAMIKSRAASPPRFEEPRILSISKLVQATHPIGWPPNA
jgi:hypothetical protein